MWCFLDRFIVTFGVIIHIYIYIYMHLLQLTSQLFMPEFPSRELCPTTTLAILITQPKHYNVVFDYRAWKLHSDNVRLIAIMKGEAPNTTLAILITKPKHYSVAFDDRAGKLHSDNVRLIARMKGEVPTTTLAYITVVYARIPIWGTVPLPPPWPY